MAKYNRHIKMDHSYLCTYARTQTQAWSIKGEHGCRNKFAVEKYLKSKDLHVMIICFVCHSSSLLSCYINCRDLNNWFCPSVANMTRKTAPIFNVTFAWVANPSSFLITTMKTMKSVSGQDGLCSPFPCHNTRTGKISGFVRSYLVWKPHWMQT